MYSEDEERRPMTVAEARLESDFVLGSLDFPDPGPNADHYFAESFELIRKVDQPVKVRSVLESYLRHVCGEDLRNKIRTFLDSLETHSG